MGGLSNSTGWDVTDAAGSDRRVAFYYFYFYFFVFYIISGFASLSLLVILGFGNKKGWLLFFLTFLVAFLLLYH